ncbi:MAG: hypothetical protein ABS36_11330 [Acidobacteria bacterium SCN 69-37]|nr:MAG: hypothetical protein ABS36_11330 [Acidobacteria bacterium SCN 69-37]
MASVVLLAGSAAAPAQDAAARADAASMQRKIIAIVTRGELPASKVPMPIQRTSFTEREVNAYFRVNGPEFLPAGVVDPRVTIDRAGQVRARAIVDLDLALKPKERGWLDPLAYLGGKTEVTAVGTLEAASGRGVFRLANATLGGVTIPKAVLQEILAFYTRSEDYPRGFQLDEPFTLPSAIRSVETMPGRATVVQ